MPEAAGDEDLVVEVEDDAVTATSTDWTETLASLTTWLNDGELLKAAAMPVEFREARLLPVVPEEGATTLMIVMTTRKVVALLRSKMMVMLTLVALTAKVAATEAFIAAMSRAVAFPLMWTVICTVWVGAAVGAAVAGVPVVEVVDLAAVEEAPPATNIE